MHVRKSPAFALVLAAVSLPHAILTHSEPDEYYPAYPGTSWEYSVQVIMGGDTTTSTVRRTVSPAYRLHSLHSNPISCPAESTFVPVVDETATPGDEANLVRAVYGASRRLGEFFGCGRLVEFLKKEVTAEPWPYVADTRPCGINNQGQCPTRSVLSKDSVFLIGTTRWDSLLHVREVSPDGSAKRTTDEFYRKGVGLVRSVTVDSRSGTRREERLIGHFPATGRKRGQILIPLKAEGMGTSGMPLSYAGNIWTQITPAFPPNQNGGENQLEVHPRHENDTLELRVRATSGLAPSFALKAGKATLAEDRLILPHRWQGLLVEMRQEGDAQYTSAPILRLPLCARPMLTPRYDAAAGVFSLQDFPDSLVRWVYAADAGAVLEDTVGRGATHVPRLPGFYGARIAAGAFDDSLCGASPYLFSENLPVHSVSIPMGGTPMTSFKLRVFGVPLSDVLLEKGAEPAIEVFDMAGNRIRSPRLSRVEGALSVSAPSHAPAPGIYCFVLTAGKTKRSGRFPFIRP